MPELRLSEPAALLPYLRHGVDLTWRDGDKDATGDCPMCGREGKFNVKIDTGVYHCFPCDAKGNARVFLKWLWETSDEQTTNYSELQLNRRLLNPDTLVHWGVVYSVLTHEWLVPGYNAAGQLTQLYRYAKLQGQKPRLLPTSGVIDGNKLGHALHGVNLYDAAKGTVILCEGPWDGMAFWEVLGQAKRTDAGLVATGNPDISLLSDINVLAAPGCNVFFDKWLPLFAGKHVILPFDSDHPRKHPTTGKMSPPAGAEGLKRVVAMLEMAKPASISYLYWGKDGYDPTLPSGYDVRDALTGQGEGLAARLKALAALLERLRPYPGVKVAQASADATEGESGSKQEEGIACTPCNSYRALISSWRKALKWTDGLDRALSVMLASITSTKTVGDQLWIKIIGPASCGKSTLCEAVSVNRRYVLAKSTIRGFHSGFSATGDSEEDNSLISKLANKTLVTKDGDTLLQSPNLGQILAEARDLYDTTSRTHYRNRMSKSYEGVRMTWILCGTSSLRALDSSELGERFLDCVIMDGIDDEMEDEILWRVVNRTDRNMSLEADGKAEGQNDPDLAAAMQLTGGYVDYLRVNATDLLSQIDSPEWALRKCTRLGKFVAHMRARPSLRQEETAEREFASRLVSQLVRLAKCLAAVMNKKAIDKEVMRRTTQVALDTSRGQTLDIAHRLYLAPAGMESYGLALLVGKAEDKTKALLRFLKRINAVDAVKDPKTNRVRWSLTKKMRGLYQDVVGTDD